MNIDVISMQEMTQLKMPYLAFQSVFIPPLEVLISSLNISDSVLIAQKCRLAGLTFQFFSRGSKLASFLFSYFAVVEDFY